jgi:hypothetical protein
MLGDQLARQREVEIAQGQGRRHRKGKILPWPLRAARIQAERRRAPRRRQPEQALAGSASSATSTWRCTCRCAMRTRRRSCRSPRCTTASTAQVEGVVTESRIQFRPRRQLVVRIADDSGDLVMRFLHFYPSQQKSLAVGRRVRARGEARGGFFGLEMVHPVARS